MRKVIFTTVVLLWMILIFWFSAQPAEESDSMSLSVGGMVGRVFVPDYEEWTRQEQEKFAEKINYPVRKAAHMTEYAILGILFIGAYGSYGMRGKSQVLYSLFCSIAYACTDEFHQLFVPGRGGRLTDVVIDSCGALIGILVITFIGKTVVHKKKGNAKWKI